MISGEDVWFLGGEGRTTGLHDSVLTLTKGIIRND